MTIPRYIKLHLFKGGENILYFEFDGDISSDTLTLEAWQYSNAALDFSINPAQIDYGASVNNPAVNKTRVTFDLSAANVSVNWRHGRFAIRNQTQSNFRLLSGPALVNTEPS